MKNPWGKHPMYVEAENLEVSVDGETIVDVELNVGYLHRGIEELMQRRNWIQNIYLAERICGICMPGEHEIILGGGSIVKLSDFVDEKIPFKPSTVASIPTNDHSVITCNNMHTKSKNITAIQKVACPPKLFRIRTMSGNELKFTGDHPIMIDTLEGPKMIKTKQVKSGDRVYSPRKIDIDGTPLKIINCLPEDFKVVLNRKYYLKLSSQIRKKYGNLTNFAEKSGINPWRMQRMRNKLRIHELKRLCKFMGLEWETVSDNIEEASVYGLTIKLKEHQVTEVMMNVLGLLASDGYFGNMRHRGEHFNHRITFVNKEEKLINEIIKFHKKWFPSKKIDRFVMQSTTPAVRISNPVLTFIARKLGLNALDRKTTDIKEIFKLPEYHIAAFLRGYFDGDGTCRYSNNSMEVIFYTCDKLMTKRLGLLLKRVGIASSLSSSASTGFKKGIRYSVSITNKEDIFNFIKKIGSSHPKKVRKLKDIQEIFKHKKTFTSIFQFAPKRAGPLLRELRKKYGITYKDIGALSDLSKIEKGTKNVMKWRMKKYLSAVRKIADKDDKQLKELEELLSDRFFVEPIKEIEEIDSDCEHVYDLTVDGVHNFIPEGAFVVGNCSGVHSITYCRMVENLLGVKIPERASYIRTIILELERLHSHMLYLGVMGYEMGLDTMFHYTWRDREHVMEMLEKLSGNRVNYAMPTIGGVRRNIPSSYIQDFLKNLNHLDKRTEYYDRIFSKDRVVLARTRNIGILSRKDAERFSIVGPVARASGVPEDIRKASPYLAYDSVDWSAVSLPKGDVQARILVRVRELRESIKIIMRCLGKIPLGDVKVRVPFMVPEGEAVARTEAPRGELIYYGRSNGSDRPERIKIRTPTFANLLSLKPMLKEQQLADLPVIVASIDPCFSCTDRITLVDVNSGKRKTLSEQEFRRRVER